MCSKEISIEEFCRDVSRIGEFEVDIDSLIGACAASPVHIRYYATKALVHDTYPETIVLKSGDSYILVSQIQKVVRVTDRGGKSSYKVTCGRLKALEIMISMSEL